MSDDLQEIRGVLIQVQDAQLLLPNATVSEVLSYAQPEAIADAPDWLLGRIRWRGWELPLVAFSRMAGIAPEEGGGLGSKVAVLKALRGDARLPYFALLTQGFPRLVTVSRGVLGSDDDDDGGQALPEGVLARVRHNDNPALVPDLDAIQTLVEGALKQAA